MKTEDGFKAAKKKVLRSLADGTYLHEQRSAIDVKNWLEIGRVRAEDVAATIRRCNRTHHSSAPHHGEPIWTVHVLKRDGWYIKFYFVDPETISIIVHR